MDAPPSPLQTLVGVAVVRNEGDVIGQVLRHAAVRHDLVVVVDAASTDDTRAEIEAVAREHGHVVLLGTLPEPTWAEPVRRHVWRLLRPHAPPGTWWSWVDGDEMTDADLHACVRAAEAEGADHIEGNSALFFYRESDARAWRAGRETPADRVRPIGDRRRHYRMDCYSLRLFREMDRLRWRGNASGPDGLVRPWSRRVDYRHYQYRDLPQIEERLRVRQALPLPEDFTRQHYHWGYDVDQALARDDDPRLLEWRPGEPLVPDPDLPPVWVPPVHVRAWRRLRFALGTLAPEADPAPPIFPDLDPRAVLDRRRRAGGDGASSPPDPSTDR